MGATVLKVLAHPDDRIEVIGTVDGHFATDPATSEQTDQLATLIAYGWASAMRQHFDPATYGSDGHRHAETPHCCDTAGVKHREPKPKAMNAAEQKAYWEQLLVDAAGVPEVLFEAKAPAKRTAAKETAPAKRAAKTKAASRRRP